NDFLETMGINVGASLVDDTISVPKSILKNKKIILPKDAFVVSKDKKILRNINEIQNGENILDLGPVSIDELSKYIKKSKMILWNGPLGKYENGGEYGTKQILKLIAKSSAKSIIGGGDTVEMISEMKMEKKFTFVSTGGGATLDFLAKGTLPGIKALR
ncbi:MAG: phosphoglycerate kinase, partial [Candidatus Paceibacterota bacterium]